VTILKFYESAESCLEIFNTKILKGKVKLTIFNMSSIRTALLVALLIQNYPTSSFSLSPIHNRFWTPLRASEDVYNSDDERSSSNDEEDTPNRFEKFVRNVSKQKDYKFGDLSKKMVNATTTGVEGAVKTVTGNEEYNFGDCE